MCRGRSRQSRMAPLSRRRRWGRAASGLLFGSDHGWPVPLLQTGLVVVAVAVAVAVVVALTPSVRVCTATLRDRRTSTHLRGRCGAAIPHCDVAAVGTVTRRAS